MLFLRLEIHGHEARFTSPSPLIIEKSPRHIPADGTPHPVPLARPGPVGHCGRRAISVPKEPPFIACVAKKPKDYKK
jgi:hypothetical protein